MAAKSDGRRKMKKSSDVAFTPLQDAEHSGSAQALAPGWPSGPGAGPEDAEAAGPGCCPDGGGCSRCCCCCAGSGGAGGGSGVPGGAGGGAGSALCLRLGGEQRRYSPWDCLWVLAAVAVYFADVGTDVWLAVDYYVRGQRWWFGLTLFFVVLGSLSVQVFSFRWFAHDFSTEDSAPAAAAAAAAAAAPGCPPPGADCKTLAGGGSAAAEGEARPSTPQRQAPGASKSNVAAASSGSNSSGATRASGKRRSASCSFCIWLLQSLIHILQLGQIWRYFHTIYLGIRSRQSGENDRWRFYWKMVYEYADVSMLHLLATFLESAPQLVLQLCIIVQTHRLQALQE
ncbi:XK-related protein 4 [Vulpes lagopus]